MLKHIINRIETREMVLPEIVSGVDVKEIIFY